VPSSKKLHPSTEKQCSQKFGALSLAAVVALAVTRPEHSPLLLPIPTWCKIAILLMLAGVGFVEAASLLTLEAACSPHQPREHHDMEGTI